METAVIEFLFSALAQLAAQYPDAAWLAVALSAVMTVCGLCAVATVWMPVPKGTAGQNRGAVADGRSETVQAEVKAVTGK